MIPAETPDPLLAMSERVAGLLRARILDGQILPGERIRQEEIASEFGTSRLPVREALRMLATEGLTELSPNRGARVPALDLDQLTLLYRMRERLEPLALTESLPLLSDETIGELRRLQMRIASDEGHRDFLALDREFHLLSYSGCTSPQLMESIMRFWNTSQHYRRLFMQVSGPQRMWVVNAEHNLLLDAIERRDVEDAERYLVGHIRRTRVELMRHPEMFATKE